MERYLVSLWVSCEHVLVLSQSALFFTILVSVWVNFLAGSVKFETFPVIRRNLSGRNIRLHCNSSSVLRLCAPVCMTPDAFTRDP